MSKFQEVISVLRHGQAVEDLDDAMLEAVKAAQLTGKKAKIQLVITIEPKGNSGQYIVVDAVKTTLPSLPKEQTILFGTPEGNLQKDDPHQRKLPLRELDDNPIDRGSIKNVHDLVPVAQVKVVSN